MEEPSIQVGAHPGTLPTPRSLCSFCQVHAQPGGPHEQHPACAHLHGQFWSSGGDSTPLPAPTPPPLTWYTASQPQRLRPEMGSQPHSRPRSSPKPAYRLHLPCTWSPHFSPSPGWTKPPLVSPWSPLSRFHSPASFPNGAAIMFLHSKNRIMGPWVKTLLWLSHRPGTEPLSHLSDPESCVPGQQVPSAGSLPKERKKRK